MAYYKIDESKNIIELYFWGRVSINNRALLYIANWQWKSSKQCWYQKLSESSIYSAKEICRRSKDYEEAAYLDVKLNGKDSRGITYIFHIHKTGESTFTVISSNNLLPCVDCNCFVSVHAISCPNCGCTITHTLKSYFDKFVNKAKLDAEYKNKLIYSLEHHAVFSSIASKMRYCSLDEIEEMIEKQEKKHRISTIPPEYLEHYNYTENALLSLNLEDLDAIEKDAYDYKRYFEQIKAKIYENTKKLFKHTFEVAVDRINEKELQAIAEKQRKRENSLKHGEKICPGCQKVFTGNKKICPECEKHKGLDAELKKLNINSGAFNRNAPVYGYYMRPVGVTDYDAKRFQHHMQILEERYIIDDSNRFEGIENMTDPRVLRIVAKHFEKKINNKFGEIRIETLYENELDAIRYFSYILLSKGHPNNVDLSEISEYKQYCLDTYKNN